MTTDPNTDDPLLAAIAALRTQVDRLIDAERRKAPIRRAAEAMVHGDAIPLPVTATSPSARVALGTVSSVSSEPRPELAAPTTPLTGDRVDDPRLRLDALAERLAGRLRQAQAGRQSFLDRSPAQPGAE